MALRILHIVTNADLGGAPRVVTELANRASRDGHACAVASVPEGPLWEGLLPSVERIRLLWLRREIEPLVEIRAWFELRRLFGAWKPDIIHLHSSKVGVLGRLASGARAQSIVYTIHGFDTILKSYRAFLPLERMLAGRCGALVPVSDYDARSLMAARIGGAHHLIRNGVTDRRGRKGGDAGAIEAFGAARAAGAKVVLCIARLARPKRFDLFVEVARRFEAREARFFWIGNVPGSLEEAGIVAPPNAVFLGELPEAGNYANYCDVFLLLSDYEGLPMSVLEAMSCGKPVVASRVGGLPEALGADCGALVDNEAGQVETALRGLLEPGRAARAGEAVRERYEASFSAEAMWENYLELYGSIVGRGLG